MSRVAVFLAAIVCAAPAQTAYFAQIDDLPIAPGLEETTDRFEFANEAGRVLGSSARGPGNAEQARAFYQAALPPLGWALSIGSGGENEAVYIRNREQLSLSFVQRGGELEVKALVFYRAPPRD